jgi:hypothetical protein
MDMDLQRRSLPQRTSSRALRRRAAAAALLRATERVDPPLPGVPRPVRLALAEEPAGVVQLPAFQRRPLQRLHVQLEEPEGVLHGARARHQQQLPVGRDEGAGVLPEPAVRAHRRRPPPPGHISVTSKTRMSPLASRQTACVPSRATSTMEAGSSNRRCRCAALDALQGGGSASAPCL